MTPSRVVLVAVFTTLASFGMSASVDTQNIAERLSAPEYKTRAEALCELEAASAIPDVLFQRIVDIAVDSREPTNPKDAAFKLVGAMKAIDILSRIGPPVVPALRAYARTPASRWYAVSILQRFGHDALPALPELIDALGDKNENGRYFAAKTIMQLGPDAALAVDALIPLIDDKHNAPQEYAIKALGEIGPAATKALPVLKKKRRYRDSITEDYVKEAIQKIERS
jgi:HEAT repeat protein